MESTACLRKQQPSVRDLAKRFESLSPRRHTTAVVILPQSCGAQPGQSKEDKNIVPIGKTPSARRHSYLMHGSISMAGASGSSNQRELPKPAPKPKIPPKPPNLLLGDQIKKPTPPKISPKPCAAAATFRQTAEHYEAMPPQDKEVKTHEPSAAEDNRVQRRHMVRRPSVKPPPPPPPDASHDGKLLMHASQRTLSGGDAPTPSCQITLTPRVPSIPPPLPPEEDNASQHFPANPSRLLSRNSSDELYESIEEMPEIPSEAHVTCPDAANNKLPAVARGSAYPQCSLTRHYVPKYRKKWEIRATPLNGEETEEAGTVDSSSERHPCMTFSLANEDKEHYAHLDSPSDFDYVGASECAEMRCSGATNIVECICSMQPGTSHPSYYGEHRQQSTAMTRWRRGRKSVRRVGGRDKRPISTALNDLWQRSCNSDNLWRFKSELQLNITRGVEKVRSRVSKLGQHHTLSFPHHGQHKCQSCAAVDQGDVDEGEADSDDVYGDDWSSTTTDDEDPNSGPHADDEGQNGKERCSGDNPPVKGSSCTVHHSLFEEIESAYYELECKRRSQEQQQTSDTDTPTPSSEVEEGGVQTVPKGCAIMEGSNHTCKPPSPQTTHPSSSSVSSSGTSSVEEALHAVDTHPCASSSGQKENRLVEKEPSAKENENDDGSLKDGERSPYQSKLPAPQPLYQIYMFQEQERLLKAQQSKLHKSTEGEPVLGRVYSSSSSSAYSDKSPPDQPSLSPPGREVMQANSKQLASLQAIGRVTALEEHESDSVCDSNEPDDGHDASILVRRQSSSASASSDSGRGADALSRVTSNTSMRRDRLTAGSVYGSQRSLWCELAEVRSAGLLHSLDTPARKLQEAYFEVITSEASYLSSLSFLVEKFFNAPQMLGSSPKNPASAITVVERKHLFSNIQAIRDCSEKLLCDLESRLEESLILSDVCDILCEHFEHHFLSYVKYCSNQVYQDRTLKHLKEHNSQFTACVQKIEANRECQGLDMRSFLMLPMQRVTRYPLLICAILDRLDGSATQQHYQATRALTLASQLVTNCNEGARKMEITEQLLEIERKLVYESPDIKRIPLVSASRYVVKSGPIMQLLERRPKTKLNMLQSKERTKVIHLFLFNDLLLIAKKRTSIVEPVPACRTGQLVCKDYASRRFIETLPLEPHSHQVPVWALSVLPGRPHLFACVLMRNARGKQVELLLNAESESDRERWLSAMRPPTCANPGEKIYAEWDCPQALSVHDYEADQEDELSLEKGDLINIRRKMPDGWFHGERVKDGKSGWFPSSYVEQIVNDHVRAKHYRERLRVIQAAEFASKQQSQRPGAGKRSFFALNRHFTSPLTTVHPPSSSFSPFATTTTTTSLGSLRCPINRPRPCLSSGSLGDGLSTIPPKPRSPSSFNVPKLLNSLENAPTETNHKP